jgi:hypothetical protein
MCATVASWLVGNGNCGGSRIRGRSLGPGFVWLLADISSDDGYTSRLQSLLVVDNRCGSCLCSFEWVYVCE